MKFMELHEDAEKVTRFKAKLAKTPVTRLPQKLANWEAELAQRDKYGDNALHPLTRYDIQSLVKYIKELMVEKTAALDSRRKDSDLIKIAEKIVRDCQPYLQQANGGTLWRGIKHAAEGHPVGIENARLTDRKPKDSDEHDHNTMNRYFNTTFGHPYRNGVFATGGQHTAETYGPVCAIWPIGDFDFIWSERLGDLYSSVLDDDEYWMDTFNYLNDFGDDYWDMDQEEEHPSADPDFNVRDHVDLDDVLDNVGDYMENKYLPSAIQSENEIMIWVPSYYYVHFELIETVESYMDEMS